MKTGKGNNVDEPEITLVCNAGILRNKGSLLYFNAKIDVEE